MGTPRQVGHRRRDARLGLASPAGDRMVRAAAARRFGRASSPTGCEPPPGESWGPPVSPLGAMPCAPRPGLLRLLCPGDPPGGDSRQSPDAYRTAAGRSDASPILQSAVSSALHRRLRNRPPGSDVSPDRSRAADMVGSRRVGLGRQRQTDRDRPPDGSADSPLRPACFGGGVTDP